MLVQKRSKCWENLRDKYWAQSWVKFPNQQVLLIFIYTQGQDGKVRTGGNFLFYWIIPCVWYVTEYFLQFFTLLQSCWARFIQHFCILTPYLTAVQTNYKMWWFEWKQKQSRLTTILTMNLNSALSSLLMIIDRIVLKCSPTNVTNCQN